jgi:hypothetical protein
MPFNTSAFTTAYDYCTTASGIYPSIEEWAGSSSPVFNDGGTG